LWGLQDPCNKQAIATHAEAESMVGHTMTLQQFQGTQQQGEAGRRRQQQRMQGVGRRLLESRPYKKTLSG
jgi:hypothetical protein